MPSRADSTKAPHAAASTATPDSSRVVRTVMHDLRSRLLHVSATERIGPRMQRITLGGEHLEQDFPFPAFAAPDHVKIVLPDPATGVVPLPAVQADRLVRLHEIPTPVRDYTVRSVGEAGLVLDFVLHDHGPAGTWAAHAAVGDPLGVLGPRGSHVYPDGYSHYVLVADETALPAIGRWLDEPGWAARVDVHVLVQSVDEYPLPEREGTRVTHHVHPLGTARVDALAALGDEIELTDDTFVYAAGEADSLKPFRRALKARGVPRERFDVDGYWRQGTANLDHHVEDDDD